MRMLFALGVLLSSALAQAAPLWEELTQASARGCRRLLADAQQAQTHDQPQRAVEMLQAAASRCPKSVEVLVALGESHLTLHAYADARHALESALRVDDEATHPSAARADLLFHLGFVREVTGDLPGAVEAHRALETLGGLPSPNRYLVHYNLGDELMTLGRLGEAIDEYRRAVVLAPERPVPRLALAVALDRDGQVQRALVEARTVLSLDPQLRRLDSGEYVFVPAAELYAYRAQAAVAAGMMAEARLQLRTFLADEAEGPYVAHARQRLTALEHQVDPRELNAGELDTHAIAAALSPLVGRLEDCLPAAAKIAHVPILATATGYRAEPSFPAAACLDPVLAHAGSGPAGEHRGLFHLPLAGKRAPQSL